MTVPCFSALLLEWCSGDLRLGHICSLASTNRDIGVFLSDRFSLSFGASETIETNAGRRAAAAFELVVTWPKFEWKRFRLRLRVSGA